MRNIVTFVYLTFVVPLTLRVCEGLEGAVNIGTLPETEIAGGHDIVLAFSSGAAVAAVLAFSRAVPSAAVLAFSSGTGSGAVM